MATESHSKLVRIPEGEFLMGSDSGQDVERPVHRVWLDGFLLCETQVTVAEYARFAQATGRETPPTWNDSEFNHPEQPVTAVSWFDSVAYCEWLRHETGKPFRLPTEAEWEYAARAGAEQKAYPWGDDLPQSRTRYSERWLRGPERVRHSEPNAFGLFEMCENVHEWCSDWFHPDYYRVSPERNPAGPDCGERKASRGGSWRHHIKVSRCATRSSIPPEFKYADYGFRVACSIGM